MKKKILALAISAVLSTSTFASMSSTTYIDQTLIRCARTEPCEIFSRHDWSVSNDTASEQNVSICYTTTVCPESPSVTRVFTECEQVNLGSMITKAGSKLHDFKSGYPWTGACKVIASTHISGWQTNDSSREGRLYVK